MATGTMGVERCLPTTIPGRRQHRAVGRCRQEPRFLSGRTRRPRSPFRIPCREFSAREIQQPRRSARSEHHVRQTGERLDHEIGPRDDVLPAGKPDERAELLASGEARAKIEMSYIGG